MAPEDAYAWYEQQRRYLASMPAGSENQIAALRNLVETRIEIAQVNASDASLETYSVLRLCRDYLWNAEKELREARLGKKDE